MSSPIIIVENLGKKYRIRHQAERQRYTALRDVLAARAKSAIRGLWPRRPAASQSGSPSTEDFWALRNVSFEVQQGDVIGIIGRNGAGKSTLLKILSRITDPSEGRVVLKGRVASLLEVGTGFHPELTGRENIFLNGAILGMTRVEIKSKFDEIVAFAEIEKFLDTPVKRYSSGMYVRLAFAVAAHLEPEILVVDEVLAVGDAQFQKKCLGKMGEVAKGGRTVLFVSHQMAAVQNLCRSAITLRNGNLAYSGETEAAIRKYLADTDPVGAIPLASRSDRQGSAQVRFTAVRLRAEGDQYADALICGHPAGMELHFQNTTGKELQSLTIAVGIDNHFGQRILYLNTELVNQNFKSVPANANRVLIKIPQLPLAPGRYGFTLFATVNGSVADWIKNAGHFDVNQGDFYGTGRLPPAEQGSFLISHSFQLDNHHE